VTWCLHIYKDYFSGEPIVDRCVDGWEEYILIRRDAYHHLKYIKELFDKQHYVIAYLASVLIGDLAMLRGTHARKNRLIARLKKFLRVVDGLGFRDYYGEEVGKLKEIIRVLEVVKGEFHRVRDPIHELIYPRLRDILEGFMEAKVKYELVEAWRRKAFIVLEYKYEPTVREYRKYIHLHVEVGDKVRDVGLSNRDVEEIIRKKEERRKRKDRDRYLDMNPEDLIMWYVPKILWGGQ